jgi:N-acetylglutamate synthase-like GNAT family acetyltransferase
MTQPGSLDIRPAQAADIPLILALINELAEFEKLQHQVVATETTLRESLFGARPGAEG